MEKPLKIALRGRAPPFALLSGSGLVGPLTLMSTI